MAAEESLQEQATRLEEEIARLQASAATLGAAELRNLADKIAALKLINQELLRSEDYNNRRIKELEAENALLDRNAGYAASRNERLEKFLIKEENLLEIQEIKLKKLKLELEVINQRADATEAEKAAKLDEIINQAKFNDLKKDELKIAEKLGLQTKEIISATMGISARWKDTFFGKLLDKDSDSIKNMKAISASIKDTVNIQNVVGSTLMKIQEATAIAFFAYDSAAASLAKVAGANEQLQDVLANTSRGATAYGISFEQAGRAVEGLYTNLNTFSSLNKGVKEELTISAAKLDKLGISSAESAKQIGTLTQIMGMSEAQAAKTSEELAGFALAIGKPPQQVAQDFAGASNQLAAYGNNMVNVFKDLEIQSKATGVAVNDLISIAEKFQTFEGAATAAGKLNAALGGGFINAMELLEASAESPAKAIDLLRTRLDDAGLAFDQMSFYEQKMIVDAGGFKSIEEASRILSQTNAQREEEIAQKQQLANQQKMLAEAIQRSIPLQEKLTMIFVNFGIVMEPVVDGISGFLSIVATLFDKVPFLSYALGGLLVIIGGFILASKIAAGIASMGAAMEVLGISLGIVAPVAAPAAASIEAVGVAGGTAAPGIAAFGGSLFTVLGPIALVAAAMALMYAGIGYLVKNLVELFKVLANTDSIGDSLLSLALAMASIGLIFTNPIVMAGLLLFSAALASIVFTLNKLDKDKSLNFATITKSIAEINVKTTTGPNNVMKQTSELITTINSFSLSKDNTAGLEKILKAAMPQQQQQQAGSAYSPTIIVKIGDKQLKNLVVEVVEPMLGNTANTL